MISNPPRQCPSKNSNAFLISKKCSTLFDIMKCSMQSKFIFLSSFGLKGLETLSLVIGS